MTSGAPDEMTVVARQMADAALARLRYWYKSEGRDCERFNALVNRLCRDSIDREDAEFKGYCQKIDAAFRPTHTEIEMAEMLQRMEDPGAKAAMKKLTNEVMDEHEQEHRHGP